MSRSAARRPADPGVAGVNPFLAGLNCRCPNCGRGPLFSGYLRIRGACSDCGFDLARADSGDGPAVFVVLICGAISCFGLLFTEVRFHWPVWLELTLWIPAAVILCLAALRPFKGVLVAMQFHNRASEAGAGSIEAPEAPRAD
jgi:uncharacterized protein (DUF983 family)